MSKHALTVTKHPIVGLAIHPNPPCPRCGTVYVPHRCANAGATSNTAAG